MTRIAILYHSGYGHTAKVAEQVAKGARDAANDVEVKLIKATEWKADEEYLNASDAIIFGSPTYMGSVAAPMKQFMEEQSKLWFSLAWKDKIAAGFTNSLGLSGDKFNTIATLWTFAQQNAMIWVGLGLMPNGNSHESLNRLSAWGGLMTQAENGPPEETPSGGDLETAKLFGHRIVEATIRWNLGKTEVPETAPDPSKDQMEAMGKKPDAA